MKPLADCRLYAFIDTTCLGERDPALVARQLCDGGADLIQIRAKGASLDFIRRMIRAVQPVTRQAGVGLVVNDHPGLARETGADYCHLGQEDFFDTGHTRMSDLWGEASDPTKLPGIGLSTHAPAEAQRALAAGPDYIAIGPVFPTPTKPEAQPVTLEYVHWAAAHLTLPWFAIGGINESNLDTVLAAGARGICIVSAILNAPDIARACLEFRKRLS